MAVIQTEDVRISMDPTLKQQADELFGEMGLSLSTACNIFVRQSLLEGAIPFDFMIKIRENNTHSEDYATVHSHM